MQLAPPPLNNTWPQRITFAVQRYFAGRAPQAEPHLPCCTRSPHINSQTLLSPHSPHERPGVDCVEQRLAHGVLSHAGHWVEPQVSQPNVDVEELEAVGNEGEHERHKVGEGPSSGSPGVLLGMVKRRQACAADTRVSVCVRGNPAACGQAPRPHIQRLVEHGLPGLRRRLPQRKPRGSGRQQDEPKIAAAVEGGGSGWSSAGVTVRRLPV